MDIFTYQIELIKKMGFVEWINKYPINPITMVAIVIIIGIIVLILNAKIRKKNAQKHKVQGSSIIILKKQNFANIDFAEQIRVQKINGEKANWFFYKTRPAIYIIPGQNEVIAYAFWAKSIQKLISTKPKKLYLQIEENKVYSLYYMIQTEQYFICEGEDYEDSNWEKKINKNSLVYYEDI